MIDDKNTQIRIIFIMNHKNTINIMYLVRCCGGEQTFRKNIQHDTLPPCHVAHDEFSRNCIYREEKRRGIAMAPYFTKYLRTQYRR